MGDFKYVMFNDGHRDVPIIFPDLIAHITMAEMVTNHPEYIKYRIVSAGFITFNPIECYGKSTTLQINSRSQDTDIILTYPWLFGGYEPYSIQLVKNLLKSKEI